jgi:hypothetical protein
MCWSRTWTDQEPLTADELNEAVRYFLADARHRQLVEELRGEALLPQLDRAELLLREIRDGKHSLPGTLVQIARYFDQ